MQGFLKKMYGFFQKCTDCTDFFRKLYGLYGFFSKSVRIFSENVRIFVRIFSKKVLATLKLTSILIPKLIPI